METRFCTVDCVPLAAIACYGAALMPLRPKEISGVTGTALCFILAGIAVAAAISPGRMSGAARVTAVIACSVGAGIIGGLILNLVPSGLTRVNWLTYALATTFIAYAVARVRGAGVPLEREHMAFPTVTLAAGAKLCAAVLVVAGAIFISISGSNHGEKTFTEVWFVPAGPAHSPVGATSALFGIKSHESGREDFTVVMNSGRHLTTHRITLAPKQAWTQTFAVEGEKAVATVYRGRPTDAPYRMVWFVRK